MRMAKLFGSIVKMGAYLEHVKLKNYFLMTIENSPGVHRIEIPLGQYVFEEDEFKII